MSYSDKHYGTMRPSQWTNIGIIILGVVLLKFVVFALLAIYKVVEVYYWQYQFNERTIVERKGVFDVVRKEIHYYRIKSIWVEEPLWMRLFGLANVHIKSSDPYCPEIKLWAIPHGVKIRDEIRMLTDQRRKEENVREFDMYNL